MGKYIFGFNNDFLRVPSSEKIKKTDLELSLRLPMEYLPDPRTIIEDAQDKEKEERDAEERRKVNYHFINHLFLLESFRRKNG